MTKRVAWSNLPIDIVSDDQCALAEEEEQEDVAKLPLWEADWDDEDVGEDFAAKLKEELATAKSSSSAGAAQPMQISK